MLAKIRVSAHDLAIEKGKFSGQLGQSRTCLACNSGLVEDKEHFLLRCVAYKTLPKDFIRKLHSISHIKVSSSILNSVILKRILNSKNQIVLKLLVKFFCALFKSPVKFI